MENIIGSFIVKKNYTPFGNDNDALPVIKVFKSVKTPSGRIIINDAFHVKLNKIEVISEEESKRILKIWEESSHLSEVSNDNMTSKHFREDNGNPKASYFGKLGFRKPLFAFKMKFPDKGFQAYICPVCGEIHIGKTKSEESEINSHNMSILKTIEKISGIVNIEFIEGKIRTINFQ